LNAFVNQKLYIKLKDTSDTDEHYNCYTQVLLLSCITCSGAVLCSVCSATTVCCAALCNYAATAMLCAARTASPMLLAS